METLEKMPRARNGGPLRAIQGFYANEEETRPKPSSTKKPWRATRTTRWRFCLSALRQQGDLPSVIKLLLQHEAKMSRDVLLANKLLEALFQSRQIDKVTSC